MNVNVTNSVSLIPDLVSMDSKQSGGDGDAEKVVAMFLLGLGSFVSGMVPAFISERNRRRFPLTTSLLLCFGAGVLLATALVHILPEVRSQMRSNFAEIALCGGFFIIYFIDEFIHYFFGEAIQHQHGSAATATTTTTVANSTCNGTTTTTSHNHNYGSNDERTPLLNDHQNGIVDSHGHGHSHGQTNRRQSSTAFNSTHCDDNVVADANARICHTSHTEPCAQSMTGTLGLFVALSLHSAIEGIAIGVQNSAAKVYILLGAVACHKFVMGFCLGLEIRSNAQTTLRSQFVGILVFALGAVCGIGVGMIIVDVPADWANTALPVIQALAGGTLFYVTVCEVIPREKARWHQNQARKAAGFGQFFAVFVGFAVMSIINFYIGDDD